MSEKFELVVVPLTSKKPWLEEHVYIRRKCLQLALEILEGRKKP